MVIDERYIKDGITAAAVEKLIARHQIERERCGMLWSYYRGVQPILTREKAEGQANNRIVCNHAKYIADIAAAYIAGNAVSYSAADDTDISAVIDEFYHQNVAMTDMEIIKGAGVCGHAYEVIYANGDAKPVSAYVDAGSAFVVYSSDLEQKKLFGVYYFYTFDIDGTKAGSRAYVCTDTEVIEFEGAAASFSGLKETERTSHYFGAVPVIEYKNNPECTGDFEGVISLIDAYNRLTSDRVNDKEQFVDSFLLLLGIDIDSDMAKRMKEERILCGDLEGRAEYLSKVLSEADVKVLRDDLKEDITRFSMVPDLSDEKFGGNLSGVAIRYKILAFEQLVTAKEKCIEEGLKERFSLYNSFLNLKKSVPIVPVSQISVTFNHNMPANESEIADMITQLSGVVSKKTLLEQIPFVDDVEEELILVEEENRKKDETIIKTYNDMVY